MLSVPVGVTNVTVAQFGSLDKNFDNFTLSIRYDKRREEKKKLGQPYNGHIYRNSSCKKYNGRWQKEDKSLGVLISVQCNSSLSTGLIIGISTFRGTETETERTETETDKISDPSLFSALGIIFVILVLASALYLLHRTGYIGKAKTRKGLRPSHNSTDSDEKYELMGK